MGAGFDAVSSSFCFGVHNLVTNQMGSDPELKTTLQINFHPDFSGSLEITHQALQRRHCPAYFVFLLRSRLCLLILAVLLPWKPTVLRLRRVPTPAGLGTRIHKRHRSGAGKRWEAGLRAAR